MEAPGDLLAMGVNSGSSWMPQAPNLHFARQLLDTVKCNLTEFTTESTSLASEVSGV